MLSSTINVFHPSKSLHSHSSPILQAPKQGSVSAFHSLGWTPKSSPNKGPEKPNWTVTSFSHFPCSPLHYQPHNFPHHLSCWEHVSPTQPQRLMLYPNSATQDLCVACRLSDPQQWDLPVLCSVLPPRCPCKAQTHWSKHEGTRGISLPSSPRCACFFTCLHVFRSAGMFPARKHVFFAQDLDQNSPDSTQMLSTAGGQ